MLSRFGWASFLACYGALFLILFEERSRTAMKSAAPMRVREMVEAAFQSVDAFANLEHAMFGLFCILTGYVCLQAVLYGATPISLSPAAARRNEWARRCLGQAAAKIPGIGAMARICGQLLRMARTVIRDLNGLRILCLSGAALILGWTSPEWRYSHWGLVPAVVWLACLAWLLWNPRAVARLAMSRPTGFIFLVAALMMLHWEVEWKVRTFATGQNSFDHAIRHLAYSFGAVLIGGLLVSRLLYRRQWVINAVVGIAATGALAALVGFYGSPLRAPAVGTRGFAVSGAGDLRPNGVAMDRGRLRLYYRNSVDVDVYALTDNGQLAPLETSREEHLELTELALPIPCGTVIIKQGDRQAVVQPVEKCPKQAKP